MPRLSRIRVLQRIYESGLMPVFSHADVEVSKNAVRACSEGGCNIFEWTNRRDGAFQVFAELERYCAEELPQMSLGVGSIDDAPTAALYINLGASFVVGPTLNPEVARLCNRRKVAYLPGCGSITEIAEAEELGCEIVKLFPAREVGGPGFIQALRGPRPWSAVMPTGGVDLNEASLKDWFEAGAVCVGAGSNLFRPEWIEGGDFASLRSQVAHALGLVKKIRRKQD